MKKLFIIAFCSLSLLTAAQANRVTTTVAPFVQNKETVVYITKTGAKYHRESCGYLRKSSIKINLSDAIKRGYTACSKCSPR